MNILKTQIFHVVFQIISARIIISKMPEQQIPKDVK